MERISMLASGTAALIVFMLGIAGCGGDNGPPPAPPSTSDEVHLQLNWMPDPQHGGFYAARIHTHFLEQNLNVIIQPGTPGTPEIEKLLMGQTEFAIANADQVLMARQQGADIVAIFAVFQKSPRCILVHQESGISSLDELHKASALAMVEGRGFSEFLKKNLNLEGLQIVPYSGSIGKFITDKKFAQQGYIFTEPVLAQEEGAKVKPLMVYKTGYDPYSSVVVTQRKLMQENPDLVRRFVTAVQRGWQIYLTDPDPANEQLRVNNPELNGQVLNRAIDIIPKLCLPVDQDGNAMPPEELGRMTLERWTQLAEQLKSVGLITDTDPALAFTNKFIPEPPATPDTAPATGDEEEEPADRGQAGRGGETEDSEAENSETENSEAENSEAGA